MPGLISSQYCAATFGRHRFPKWEIKVGESVIRLTPELAVGSHFHGANNLDTELRVAVRDASPFALGRY